MQTREIARISLHFDDYALINTYPLINVLYFTVIPICEMRKYTKCTTVCAFRLGSVSDQIQRGTENPFKFIIVYRPTVFLISI